MPSQVLSHEKNQNFTEISDALLGKVILLPDHHPGRDIFSPRFAQKTHHQFHFITLEKIKT